MASKTHQPPSQSRHWILRALDRLEETMIAALLATAVVVVLAAILQRYGVSALVGVLGWAKAHGHADLAAAAKNAIYAVTSIRLTWAQELTIFLIIWMAKFGAAYGVRTGIHVGVDILVARLEGPARSALILIALLSGALFTCIVAWLGARFVHHLYDTGHNAAVLEVPMWFVYLAVPLGSALMCFRFLEAAWSYHRTGHLPRHDHGAVAGLDRPAGGSGP